MPGPGSIACPKPIKAEQPGRTRIRRKAKPLAEKNQVARVRAGCVERDGYCRIQPWLGYGDIGSEVFACVGQSEWAHMHIRRRSQTRNQVPEVRHDTRYSLMLCRFHHAAYDAHRLKITALTRKGANGRLKFTRAK